MGCTDSKHHEASTPKNSAAKNPAAEAPKSTAKVHPATENTTPVQVVSAKVARKLYGHPVSQPSRSVQWFIDYANLDVEVEHVDIMTGKNKEPEFVAKFPNAKVPSFEKGDFKLEEGAAILEYLAEGHDIVPKDAKQRARVMMMIGRNLAQARKITVEVVLPLFFGKEEEKAEQIKAGIEKIRPELAKYDTLLSTSKYLVGDELSLADFMFVTEVDQLVVMKEAIGTDVLADYPHITAYLQRIAEVPGYKKCVGAVADIMAASAAEKKTEAKAEAAPAEAAPVAEHRKLYGHPVSQPSRSVQWFIDYANLDVEVEHVDIMTGKNKEPEFVAKFPNAKVPSFEKGDFKLEEGAAILEYLAEGHDIVPKDAKQRARVTMMIGRNLAQARKITVEVVLPLFFGKEEEKAEQIKAGIEKIRPELAKYDTLLSTSKYLVGDELSLADFMFVTEVDQLVVMKEAIGTDVLVDYPHITAYLQRIAEVPGYKKCVGAVADIMAASAAEKKTEAKAEAAPAEAAPVAEHRKLYGHPVSQPSRSVQWFIDYANLDVEVEHVDIMTGKNKEPEFVAKFPNAKVPSFEKGDFKLEEGAAILEYLAEGHDIVPKDAKQRARVMMMIGRNLAQARKITVEVVLPLFFGKEEEKAEQIKAGIEKIRPELAKYDTLLSTSKYLVGDELSLADFMFVTEVDQLVVMKEAIGTDVLADYPHITAYLQRIAEVPGYTKCVGAVADIMAASAAEKKTEGN